MTSIIGIPTTRVSNSFILQRLLSQVQYNQTELYRLQTQLSTGRRFEAPSEDPVASMRIIDIQRLIERKGQLASNIETSQSYLSATDVALSEISGMIADVRGSAIGVLGTTSTDLQRQSAAQEVNQVIQQLLDTGNQQFRGRYLFSGSTTPACPFRMTDSGAIEYLGNTGSIRSYGDLNTLFETNMTGDEAFGAISTAGEGSVDVNPIVTYDTRLADLGGGLGISPGSISISDGVSTSIVNLSSAKTLGDVAQLLIANPPAGNSLEVEITPSGFRLRLASGNLTIRDVGGGTAAQELGIVETNGAGADYDDSRDLDPILRKTTNLDDAFGSRAQAVVRSNGGDNDIIIRAAALGEDYNGIAVSFTNTAAAGNETVAYDADAKTLVVGIKAGKSTAADVVAAINAANLAGDCPFRAEVDRLDGVDGGKGLVAATAAGITDFGGGKAFDKTNGLQIVNGGKTYNISLQTAVTVEDLLNDLNGAGAGLLAEINNDKNGINIRSKISGADFTIGENGGSTAADLGVRTFTADVYLDNLNFGQGVNTYEGVDFTITRADGAALEIDLDDAETLQDVLDLINDNPQNADHALTARLAAYGNGIELVDESSGSEPLTVTRAELSTAAIELGLIPDGEESAQAVLNNGTFVLTGTDSNPQETEGIFTALLRLHDALQVNDVLEVQRAIDLLDDSVTDLNFARAELGSREQSLEILQSRLETEEIELSETLSLEYDVDIVEVMSNLTARQLAYEASLQAMGSISQLSLLDYL